MQSNDPIWRAAWQKSQQKPEQPVKAGAAGLRPYELWFDLLGFLCTVAVAVGQQWSAVDVAWGLWLSSLVLGGVFLLLAHSIVPGQDGRRRLVLSILNIGSAAMLFAFFGAFHIGHAIALNTFFPLADIRRIDSFFDAGVFLFGVALAAYWPVLLSSAVSRIPHFVDSLYALPAQTAPGLFFKGVIRMHLFIVLLGMIAWWEAAPRLTLYLLLLFFFFPFERVGQALRARQP